MDKSDEGLAFQFACSEDGGDLRGIVINRWMKGDEQRLGIDVWGQARLTNIKEVAPPGVEVAPRASEPKPKVADVPAKQSDRSPTHFFDGARNYARLHKALYEVFKLEYEGEITSEAIAEKSTHYLIGCSDNKVGGMVKELANAEKLESMEIEDHGEEAYIGEGDPPSSVKAESAPVNSLEKIDEEILDAYEEAGKDGVDMNKYPKREDEPEKPIPWQEITDSSGAVMSKMSKDDLIDLCIKLIPFSESDNPKIQAGFEAAMRSRDAMDLSFVDIYDVRELSLNQDHDMTAIADAYRKVEGDPKRDSEVVCKDILKDPKTFIQLIENYES